MEIEKSYDETGEIENLKITLQRYTLLFTNKKKTLPFESFKLLAKATVKGIETKDEELLSMLHEILSVNKHLLGEYFTNLERELREYRKPKNSEDRLLELFICNFMSYRDRDLDVLKKKLEKGEISTDEYLSKLNSIADYYREEHDEIIRILSRTKA